MSSFVTLDRGLAARFAQMREASQAKVDWPRGKQRDVADRATRFVYESQSLMELRSRANKAGLDPELTVYAEKRWVNLVRHDAWLQLFLTHPECEPWPDPRDRKRDLLVEGTPFDLKVTRYPRSCPKGIGNADLATWLYENQSREGRFHLSNRLFVCAEREQDLYDLEVASRSIDRFLDRLDQEIMSVTVAGVETTCAVMMP